MAAPVFGCPGPLAIVMRMVRWGAALRYPWGPGLPFRLQLLFLVQEHSFLHGWAAVARAQCPGLKTFCSRRQSRKHLCLCPWFLYTPRYPLALCSGPGLSIFSPRG